MTHHHGIEEQWWVKWTVRLSPETMSSIVNFSVTGIFWRAFVGSMKKIFENLGVRQIDVEI